MEGRIPLRGTEGVDGGWVLRYVTLIPSHSCPRVSSPVAASHILILHPRRHHSSSSPYPLGRNQSPRTRMEMICPIDFSSLVRVNLSADCALCRYHCRRCSCSAERLRSHMRHARGVTEGRSSPSSLLALKLAGLNLRRRGSVFNGANWKGGR